jgi:uncharacterized circularly permuted ATP-grasp superfamily protein
MSCWSTIIRGPACEGVVRYLMSLGHELAGLQDAAELAIRSMGTTFTVGGTAANIGQARPFDVIPRAISTREPLTSTARLSA